MTTCNDLGPSIGGDYINPTIKGGITIDTITAEQLVDQLCEPIQPCFEQMLEEFLAEPHGTLTIDKLDVKSSLTITDLIAEALADQMAQHLKDYILAQVNNGTFDKLTLTNATIKTSTLDTDTKKTIYDFLVEEPQLSALAATLAPKIAPFITINGGTLNDMTLNQPKIFNPTSSGGTYHQGTYGDNSFHNAKFYEGMTFDADAKAALLAAIEVEVKQWISTAIDAVTAMLNTERAERIAADLDLNSRLNSLLTRTIRLEGLVDNIFSKLNPLLECGGLGVPLVDCDNNAVEAGFAVPSCEQFNALKLIVDALAVAAQAAAKARVVKPKE